MIGLLQKLDALEPQQRWMILGMLALLLAGIGYYLHAGNADRIDTLATEIGDIRQSVEKAQAVAAQRDGLRVQLAALDGALKVAMRLLPETREIPELLTQISQLGLNAGLEFRLFKPEAEKRADFYAEVPVSLAILGKFHDVARFFDHLAKLSRIVNVTDIKITVPKGDQTNPMLSTSCLLTTFRFLEPRESDANRGGKSSGRQKGN
jgi:type IV pilus assembly protein PilO